MLKLVLVKPVCYSDSHHQGRTKLHVADLLLKTLNFRKVLIGWHCVYFSFALMYNKLMSVLFLLCVLQLSLDKKKRKTSSKGDCSYNCFKSCVIYWSYFLFLWIFPHHCRQWFPWFNALCWNHHQGYAGKLVCILYVK